MTNGKEINELMDFEKRLEEMKPDEILKFTAREVRKHSIQLSGLPCNIGGECISRGINRWAKIGIAVGIIASILVSVVR